MNENCLTQSAFCTVVTKSHIPYARALMQSLMVFDSQVQLHVLVSDSSNKELELEGEEGLHFHYCDEFANDSIYSSLKDKYFASNHDAFRWSMKSVFLKRLLTVCGLPRVIYVDSDIHFFSDYRFLFDRLDKSDVLITPHWRSSNPELDRSNFELLFTGGLYNAGFFGASNRAIPILDWWSKVCLFKCEINPSKGNYVDQTYLNLMPIIFDNVEVIKHRGCNVANWNQVECRRSLSASGNVVINGSDPIVFIHFTTWWVKRIITGDDPLLKPHLILYVARLRMASPSIDISNGDSAFAEAVDLLVRELSRKQPQLSAPASCHQPQHTPNTQLDPSISLPEIEAFPNRGSHSNAWSEHYGALHVAASYCQTTAPDKPFEYIWQHGFFGPWVSTPSQIIFNTPDSKIKRLFVAREDQATSLKNAGHLDTHAIGLPIVYLPSLSFPRIPKSLLIMPQHSIEGMPIGSDDQISSYFKSLEPHLDKFDTILACISPSCIKNGTYAGRFEKLGIDTVCGASTNDLNAYLRIACLMQQFETMTTNSWGSHVVYALHFGMKVSVFGARFEVNSENLKTDGTFRNLDPQESKRRWVENHCGWEQFLKDFNTEPHQAIKNQGLGDWCVGKAQKKSPADLRRLFGWEDQSETS